MTNNTKMLMIQGTASDSGKSTFAAALCRIFARRGIKTAPFKAWNMSQNSYLTETGKELGTAQALQAKAAFREVSVDMQPVLIKILAEGSSQLIIKGEVEAELSYQKGKNDYFKIYKKTIKNSLEKLRADNELIIIEGAGSPVEINRKNPDFANMFTAQLYDTAVLLISSIEKGGCLASLVGTLKLLSAEQRKLIKGLIINKFRGDFELLKPALEFLEDYTKKEVLAVLPYLKDLNLPVEDSASLKEKNSEDFQNKITFSQKKLATFSKSANFSSFEIEKNLTQLADLVEENLEIDKILKISEGL